jgi:hypothetical protein
LISIEAFGFLARDADPVISPPRNRDNVLYLEVNDARNLSARIVDAAIRHCVRPGDFRGLEAHHYFVNIKRHVNAEQQGMLRESELH